MNKILVTLLASIGLVSLAHAEAINFSGTVSTSCTFSNPVSGQLVAWTDGSGYILDGGYSQGNGASIAVDYTGSPTFAINAVSAIASAPGGAPAVTQFNTGLSFDVAANNAAAITAGADNFTNGTRTLMLAGSSSSDVARIKMKATAAAPWPVGNYDVNTTVTCQ